MLVILSKILSCVACVAVMASCVGDEASQGPKDGVVDWTKLVGELTGAEYYRGIVTTETKPFLVTFESGLTDEEVAQVERTYGFRFPPDLRGFLQAALPTGDGFPNWRVGLDGSLRSWVDAPKDGILFDVEHNKFWMADWGARPDSLAQANEVATKFIDAAPKLIPVFSHRMLPFIPHRVGSPVFSVHQTDIIYYGFDLEDYLRHEFELPGRRPWPDSIQPIEFWSKFL
jgi:hypothetical protein